NARRGRQPPTPRPDARRGPRRPGRPAPRARAGGARQVTARAPPLGPVPPPGERAPRPRAAPPSPQRRSSPGSQRDEVGVVAVAELLEALDPQPGARERGDEVLQGQVPRADPGAQAFRVADARSRPVVPPEP